MAQSLWRKEEGRECTALVGLLPPEAFENMDLFDPLHRPARQQQRRRPVAQVSGAVWVGLEDRDRL